MTQVSGKRFKKPRQVIDPSRRQFLKGVGGFALAMPLLPSLLVKNAYGSDPIIMRRPRLYWLCTGHGGLYESNLFPAVPLTRQMNVFADHQVGSGDLTSSINGNRRVISQVLQADSSVLTPGMVAKMNIMLGLDISFYIAHHTGGHLGNYDRNDGNGGDQGLEPRPTLDQMLAWSSSFYPDITNVRERAMVIGDGRISYGYSTPSQQAGQIQNVRGYGSTVALFNRIFNPPGNGTAAGTPVVDLVLANYQRLRNTNARLSTQDRQRLDDHMDRVSELQRRLQAPTLCPNPTAPADDAQSYYGAGVANANQQAVLFNDLNEVAFKCGATRIITQNLNDGVGRFVDANEWHQTYAHQWNTPAGQTGLVGANQAIFERHFLDLARRLDVDEVAGTTYLDNTLMVWTQESGMATHDTVSVPVITMGSAGRCVATGQLLDYRRTSNPASSTDNGISTQYLGLLYNQWLASVAQIMGMAPAEFERWGHKGIGFPKVGQETWGSPYRAHYTDTSSRYFQAASNMLPYLLV